MKTSESEFIRDRCLRLIRKSSMHEGSWEMTLLDHCHAPIASKVLLDDHEYALVSFFAGDGDWTLYTTHRLVGEVAYERTEIGRLDFGTTDFQHFRHGPNPPRVKTATIHCQQGSHVFLYESGYASMAPIYYFIFWSQKWPVWSKTHRLYNQQAEQRLRGHGGHPGSSPE